MDNSHAGLRRALSLPLLVLYGLGVTIGAGIYVLVGAAAGRAGLYAPISFCVAALVMAPTAASFAELTGRMPVSAGEAAFVRRGFNSRMLALMVGLMVVAAGCVSAGAVVVGSSGYIRVFVNAPDWLVILCVVLAMGLAAAWGILESVSLAAVLTVIEVGGLLLIVSAALWFDPGLMARLGEVGPASADPAVWKGIFGASLLAFFAFVGFEDLVNVAEETREPARTLPWAILLTLTISTLIYFSVASVAVLSMPLGELAASKAPLGDLFRATTGGSPLVISAIAIVATLNGIIVQMIMASRVLYGLADEGELPAIFGSVNPRTQTPLFSTVVVVGIILVLAMAFPIVYLAEMTSRVTLSIFMLVNLALLRIKLGGEPAPKDAYLVGIWVPLAGFAGSLALLIGDLLH
ncbi:MAG: amino acid permease [Pseudomonadota bacterium]|nr:amino acid permease [Pseudomonadota bacterium]